jgi:UDP-2-acetamido-2,6-beta-L-arabino-hexul-4-ose reductase
MPISVNDPQRLMRLNYVDDIVAEFIRALNGCPTPGTDGFYYVLPEHTITLGEIVEQLNAFHNARKTLDLPDGTDGFTKKLYATYLSFLPEDGFAYQPVSHADSRGSFTELFHMGGYGQVSVNLQKPHVVKGEHWHDTKHEKFAVVSGHGAICFRNVTGGEVIRYEVDGAHPTVVEIPPGYTHNIENMGDSDMVTLMWASETFDPNQPDTHRLPVEPV